MIVQIVSRAANYIMAFLCLVFFLSLNSCANNHIEHVLDSNLIHDVVLSVDNPDVEVIKIKSSEPMKGIYDYYAFGNNLFLVSSDLGTVYHVQGDTVVSVLNKKGRGREEYLEVQCLAYSETDSILYVKDADSEKILKYHGVNNKVVDVIFLDKSINITGFNLVDGNTLLAMGTLESNDNKNKINAMLFCISATDGKLLKEVLPLDYLSYGFLSTQDFVQCKDELIFQKPGAEFNQIISYKDGKLTELYNFSYNKKLRIPKKIYKEGFDDQRVQMRFAQYRVENDYCVGAFMPMKVDDTLFFWSAPKISDSNYMKPILNVCHEGKIDYYSNYSIPGINLEVLPNVVWKGKYACIIQGVAEEYIDNSKMMSALGSQILNGLNNNNGNPIILSFFK